MSFSLPLSSLAAALVAYCETHQLRLVHVLGDKGRSGKTNRPVGVREWQRMAGYVRVLPFLIQRNKLSNKDLRLILTSDLCHGHAGTLNRNVSFYSACSYRDSLLDRRIWPPSLAPPPE